MKDDITRDAKFWNRLQGAMIDVAKDDPPDEPASAYLWIYQCAEKFKKWKWPGSQMIAEHHVAEIARLMPMFELHGTGTDVDPWKVSVARKDST